MGGRNFANNVGEVPSAVTNAKRKRFGVVGQPVARLVKRENSCGAYRLFVRAVAVGAAFLIILLFMQGVTNFSFGKIWDYMFNGAFGAEVSVNMWLRQTALLLMVGIALAPAFKMKFWNIGAQGQILIGALLTATVMRFFAESMGYSANVFVMLLLGMLAGGIWALIPAFFKAKFGANETLFTLMMNYVAIQLVACSINVWKGNNVSLGLLNPDTQAGYLNALFGNPYGVVILFAAISVVFMAVYLNRTKHGYELTVVGDSPNTARYAGMNTGKIVMRTVFLSGAICGLVGMLYVSGVDHSIAVTTGGNYGFTAIIVAWTAKFSPVAMILVAMAIVFLERGAVGVTDNSTNLNSYTSYIIVGIFLIILISCEFFVNYKIVYNEKITGGLKKFHDKVESKAPWLTNFCTAVIYGIKKADEKVERFFAVGTEKIKLFIGNTVSSAFDCVCIAGGKAVRGIKSSIGRKKTAKAEVRLCDDKTDDGEGDNND